MRKAEIVGKIRMCRTSSCHVLLYSTKVNPTGQCPGCSSFGAKVKKVSLKISIKEA